MNLPICTYEFPYKIQMPVHYICERSFYFIFVIESVYFTEYGNLKDDRNLCACVFGQNANT